MKKFRKLRADEIDCRVAQVKKNGLSLLLYKDARCDMNILDETVGCMNWQRAHSRDNANCTVSIWDEDKTAWVSKEDTGTESFSEAEKGLASDSFKRACFNWGIGRELYTAPFIWVKSADCDIVPKGDKFACYDSFSVEKISYDKNGRVNALEIKNDKRNKIVFKMGTILQADDFTEELASEKDKKTFMAYCKKLDVDYAVVRKQAGQSDPLAPMTVEEHGKCLIILKDIESAMSDEIG